MGKEKNKRIYLRVSEEEKEILKSKADSCGLTMTNYILSASFDKKLIAIDQVKLFENMRGVQIEMNAIGKNINQYVKLLNMLNKVDGITPEVLKNIESMLLEYKNQQEYIYITYKNIRSMFI